jgi:cysteine-rich repeat protein
MKNFFRLIIGITAFLVITPVSLAKFCNPPDRTESIYEDIYCDVAMGGNEEMDDEMFEAIAEQLGYDITVTDSGRLAKFIYDTGENINCLDVNQSVSNENSINQFITDEDIEYDDLPSDIQDACRKEDKIAWIRILSKIQSAYNKEKVLYHTKKTLEYEFKAAENFYDGELRDFGDAPFDLMVDLNLIEIVLFGSQAQWNDDVWKWPTDDEDGDEGDEVDDVETPLSGASPEEGEEPEPESEPEPEGITVEITEEEGVIPECVPEDSPDADYGDHPGGSDYTNPNCGNGVIDILANEECDDSNNISGDGCNQYCMLEDGGTDLICQDHEAVTFGDPQDYDTSDESDENEDSVPNCPPGTLPNKNITITGPPPIEPKYLEADQSANYPGPSVGGTFKKFPESTAPPCPPGYSELKFEYLGEEESTCIATELCADPNKVRDFLADSFFALPTNWALLPTSDPIRQALEAVEVMVCVNITKHNRPESAYQVIEGCIDCHISAMADSLDKALESNVTPMCNTTSSFSISSKWGPTFSFSLTMAVKAKVKTWLSKTAEETIKKTDEEIENIEKKNKPKKPAISSSAIPADQIAQAAEATLNELKSYREVGTLASDSEFYPRIATLLGQMAESFKNIQGQYNAMATSSTKILSDTAACQ